MLDEKDFEKIQSMIDKSVGDAKDGILAQTADMIDKSKAGILAQTAAMIDQAKDDMLKQSAANTRVIIESSVMKKLDLLIEGQQALLETLAPKSRVEELEEEVSFLKSAGKSAVTDMPKAGASAPAFLFYLYGLFSSFQFAPMAAQSAAFCAFVRFSASRTV